MLQKNLNMKKITAIIYALSLTVLLTACSEEKSATENNTQVDTTQTQTQTDQNQTNQDQTAQDQTNVVDTHNHDANDDFTPNYIYAVELNQTYSANSVPFIFDVRSKASYQKSHIEMSLSVPYGKADENDLKNIVALSKDSEIVTYCGCPRHLSTLSAKNLTDWGYTNVKVLYEGYWHWKEQSFPVVETEETATTTTSIKFEGILANNDQPISGVDLFLKHTRSGQLEAVRTDKSGNFDVEFHLYGYQSDDRFDFIVADINNTPIRQVSGSSDNATFVEIRL